MNWALALTLIVLFIIIIWLWLIAPRRSKRAELKSLARYDYAHRGLYNNDAKIPENSLAAFRLAAESGFGIELDLQLTADKRVVVHHDADLNRSCGVNKKINDMSFAELEAYKLFKTEETIPSFEDVLKAVGRRVPLIIEIKSYTEPHEVCKEVWKILKDYEGEYCIESFDPRIVKWFKDNCPEVVRGQLMEHLVTGEDGITFLEAFAGRNMLSNFLTRPDFEAYNFQHRHNPSLRLARRALKIWEVSWTIKNWNDYRLAKEENCICIFEGFEPDKELQAARNIATVKFEKAEGSAVASPITKSINRSVNKSVNIEE